MNAEKPTQMTADELQAILKEDYIRSSGGMLVGETVVDYRKRKEEEWNRMHPGQKSESGEGAESVEDPELEREKTKEFEIWKQYIGLTDEEKLEFPDAQKEVAQVLREMIKGGNQDEALSPEERFVVDKIRSAYTAFKKDNPDKPFSFELEKEVDKKTYENLAQRLAIKVMNSRRALRGQGGEALQGQTKEEGEEKLLEKFDEFSQKALEKLKGDKNRVATYLGLQKLFQEMRQGGSREKIIEYVLKESYSQKRKAEYAFDPNYEKAWDLATTDDTLPRREEGNWIFRGNFTSKERKTVTRGSLNITVTEDVVRDLDSLIKKGVIDANYKFGEPGVETEALSRHDAVTVYFLTEPTPEAVKALSEVADKYYRGDDLLGKKISKGFYMSEFGSVSDTQAEELAQKMAELDPEVGRAVKDFLTNQKGRVAMSEAQFYSIKETLDLLRIDVEYSPQTGFKIEKIEK